MTSVKKTARIALFAIVGAAYLGASHFFASAAHPPKLGLLVSLTPLCALAVVASWNSRHRMATILLCAVFVMAVVANLDALSDHLAWLYFVQHAGAMIALGVTFGSTLGGGDEQALCSRIARHMPSTRVDGEYMRYTWRVTLAWALFFVLMGAISTALFFLGPIEIWSAFANLLTPILVGAMFLAEYLVRLRYMPNRTHFGILATIQAYREYTRR